MKIAIHQPRSSYYIGGAEVTSMQVAKTLSKENNIVFITSRNNFTENFKNFINNNKSIQFVFIDNLSCDKISSYPGLNTWDIEGILFGEASKEFYELNNYDMIVTFYSTDLLTLNKGKAITILHMQGYPNEIKKIDKICYSLADVRIPCSNHVSLKIKEMFGLDSSLPYYSYPDFNLLKIDENKKRDIDVVYIGRLNKRKGIDVLLEALKDSSLPINKVIIAGHGELERLVIDKINSWDLGKKVEFVGPIQISKVIDLLNRAKIFILPAKSKEPLPKTILEAMALGANIITTNVGGIPEIISDRFNGLLIEPDNPEALKKAVELLIVDKSLSDRLRVNGFKYLKDKFDINNKEKELLNLYLKFYLEKNGKI